MPGATPPPGGTLGAVRGLAPDDSAAPPDRTAASDTPSRSDRGAEASASATTDILTHANAPLPDARERPRTEPAAAPTGGFELARGSALGRYVVLERIGAGTMGVVFRAYDPELDRRLAIKLVAVRGRLRKRGAEVRARLLREAQALARVDHPNVIQVHDVGTFAPPHDHDGGGPLVFVAMEYVDGGTLRTWLAAQPRAWPAILDVFIQAGRGLAAAHAADLIHRDFKPDNVMVGRDGRVRVLDFGLARAASGGNESAPESIEFAERAQHSVDFDDALTQDGTILGTPAYMAPELHVGAPAVAASDQFAFCVALWEALYGERPFAGESHAAIAFNIMQGRLRAVPSDRRVPRWLHRVLLVGLAGEAKDRFASMTALVDELARDRGRIRRRVAVAIAIGGVAAAAYAAPRANDPDRVCPEQDERLAAAWNPAVRDELAASFAATSLPFARESWQSTAALLDDFGTRWQHARTEACRATHVRGEQSEALLDLRMTCLDRRLGDFEALLAVYRTPTRDAVVGAVEAARGLPDLRDCSDTTTLVAHQRMPDDPALRERITTAQTELTRIRAALGAGDYRGAAPQLAALRDELLAIDWAPLSLELLHLHARVELETGATTAARDDWEQAFAEAIVAGDLEHAAFVASKLVYVASRMSTIERGRSWARIGHTLLGGFEDDGSTEVALWSAEGALATTAGDWTAGLAAHRRVQAFWEQQDPASPELAVALGNVGTILRMIGDANGAMALHRRELAIDEAALGAQHPDCAIAMRHIGLCASDLGDQAAARAALERALTILRASQGDSTEVATALDELGRVARRQGRLAEAEAHHREALALWRRELGDRHPDVVVSWMNVGYTQLAAGDHAGALATFDEALAHDDSGPDHPHAIYGANATAKALLQLERAEEARTRLEAALRSKAVAEVDPTLVAETKFLLAQALVAGSNDSQTRARAVTLAIEAQTSYATDATRYADDLREIDGWLAHRGASPSQHP